ncbi:glycosyltransferase [Natrinema salaciae]|uniref:Glycosyltransferase involved in cell wall bisynthesis n=1 Tax=Natrinema salaciae TaxID=1186196 RepID=A0A1H9SDX2_9EURY|nr:glycosyltransferase [Natrinema salaciae]SER82563.1 Glycosyltransferase involved in cell wall bisynthesis [Natrinema salaciae]
MTTTSATSRVLWLTPDKPADISVGRQRIADHLSSDGIAVALRGTTPKTVLQSLREADRYDVVVGTTRAGAIAGLVLKLATGTPLVVDHIDPIRQFEATHPRWLGAIVRQLENAAFRIADHVLYVYAEEEDRVERFASATKTDLGVEFDRFANPPEETVSSAKSALGPFDEENVAIYVGGLEPIYHIRDLLDAFTAIDGWTLVVLGTGSLADLVERTAAAHECIVFPGTVDHHLVPGYLHAADVGICLVDDPHTLKVLEYGAAGVPTVQVRGRAENRFDGRVEFCDPTPDSIARAVERAATADPTPLQSFARAFDWSKIAETYKQVITTVK